MTLMIGTALECNCLPLAAGIALGFHCFLRTGELFALHCSDVQVGEKGGAVVLQHTKKGMRDIVSINDPLVLTLVKMRLLHSCAGDWFCDMPAAKARVMFADFLKALELTHLGLRWYSLRRGGATHHFCKFGQMEAPLSRAARRGCAREGGCVAPLGGGTRGRRVAPSPRQQHRWRATRTPHTPPPPHPYRRRRHHCRHRRRCHHHPHHHHRHNHHPHHHHHRHR